MASEHLEVAGHDFERRLCEILAAYYEAVEAGQVSDRAEWLARYPDLADEAGRFLDGQDQLLALTEPLRPTADEAASERLLDNRVGAKARSIDDYELIDEIARGGMGIVFRARQRSLNRPVALKMLRGDALTNQADQERFLREAKAVASLDHPNIVPIFEVGRQDGHNYFTMKLVEGRSLAQRLPDFTADQKIAARLIATVALAVSHAHQRGILHRDLKPSNILVDEQGEPHVSDFGLAKWVEEDSDLTQSGAILGTPAYMAPEQAGGKKGGATTATDVYGLGAILYTLLTGRPPFEADSLLETIEDVKGREPDPPSTVNRRVERDLETICLKCLEKEPDKRYRSAQDLADELKRWLRGESIVARRVGPIEHVWRWCRRNPRAAALLTAMTMLALCAVVGFAVALNARDAVAQVNRDIVAREILSRRKLYLANIVRASTLIDSNNITEARAVLARLLPVPGIDDQRDFEWYYLWRLCHLGRQTLRGHEGDVYHADFSPDGRVLATCGRDKTIRLWDVPTGTPRMVLTGHSHDVNYVAFAPDGKTLASASEDQTVKLWNTATGREIHTLLGHHAEVVSALFAPDGHSLVTGDRDGQVIVWDPAAGRQQSSFCVGPKFNESLAISGDGSTLAAGGNGVSLWNLVTRRQIRILDETPGTGLCVTFVGNGSAVVATSEIGVRRWFSTTGKPFGPLSGRGPTLFSVVESRDNRFLAWADRGGAVEVWQNGAGYAGKIPTGQGRVWCAAFAPDSRTLATTSQDGTVKLWDVVRDRDRQLICVGAKQIRSLAFSPASQNVFGVLIDGTVLTWESTEGKVLSERQFPHIGQLVDATLSRDGTTLALLNSNKTCEVWDVKTGRRTLSIENAARRGKVKLSHNGKWLSGDGADPSGRDRIRIWNTVTGHESVVGSVGMISAWTFSPDQNDLAWASLSSGVPLTCNLTTGQTIGGKGRGHFGGIQAIEFAPDGKTVATEGQDRLIKLWDVDTLEEHLTWGVPNSYEAALSFSPDGRTLASVGGGFSLVFGDIQSHEVGLSFQLACPATEIGFSPDGCTLAMSGNGHHPGVWVISLWLAPRVD